MARSERLFVDTWGWLTLRDRREAAHQETVDFYSAFRRRNGIVCTTDYVLDETITLLFRRLPFPKANASLEKIEAAERGGYLRVERVTPEHFERAKALCDESIRTSREYPLPTSLRWLSWKSWKSKRFSRMMPISNTRGWASGADRSALARSPRAAASCGPKR